MNPARDFYRHIVSIKIPGFIDFFYIAWNKVSTHTTRGAMIRAGKKFPYNEFGREI
jgi:hypothetical protein